MIDTDAMLKGFEYGCGFKKGEALIPRLGAHPFPADLVKEQTIVVLEQSPLAPHQYRAIGENVRPTGPGDKFVMVQINGHEWRRRA